MFGIAKSMSNSRPLYRFIARVMVLTLGVMSVSPAAARSCGMTPGDHGAHLCECSHHDDHASHAETSDRCCQTSAKSMPSAVLTSHSGMDCCAVSTESVEARNSATVTPAHKMLRADAATWLHIHSPPPDASRAPVCLTSLATPAPAEPLFILHQALLR